LLSGTHGGVEERGSFPERALDAMATRATHGGGRGTWRQLGQHATWMVQYAEESGETRLVN